MRAERFDHVIVAAHSDQALRMLADASDREHEILGSIPYQPNEAVLHTDRRLLPRRRRAWASWNYHLGGEPTGRTRVTYHMNRLQSLRADREFCVTLNRSEAIDPRQRDTRRSSTTTRSTPRAGRSRRSVTRRSAAPAAPTTAAPTGAGASTRTAWLARCSVCERLGARLA